MIKYLSNPENRILQKFLIILAVILGIYFRFKGLGTWPLAVDEYYFIKSVENILKYGIPQFEHGGFYTRGIIQQYLTAGNLLLGFNAEFGGRVIPVLCNLLALPALYMIGKKISGETVAAWTVILFSLSLWEVEMARFLRMYAPFQTLFIWYCYFLYKALIESDKKSGKWIWIISSVSIFVYEASIFLVLMNFIYVLWDKDKNTINLFSISLYKKNILKISGSLFLLLIAYYYLSIKFRTLGQVNLYPPELVEYFKNQVSSRGILREPILFLQLLGNYTFWTVLFSFLVTFNFFNFFKIIKNDISIFSKISFLFLIVLSILNLIGLLFLTFILLFLVGWLKTNNIFLYSDAQEGILKSKYKPTKLFVSLVACWGLNLFFWILFSVNTTDWHIYFPAEEIVGLASSIKVSLKYFLNYPNFYETFVLFRETLPIITIIILILFAFLFIKMFLSKNESETRNERFLMFILILLVLFINLLDLQYFDTRYFFFLFPLILILGMVSVITISKSVFKKKKIQEIIFSFGIILILYFSEDFNLMYLLNIDSYDTNFRVKQSLELKKHFYPRWDVRTPAQFVNENSLPDDVIISNEQINEKYLNRLDYVFIDYRGKMAQISVAGGSLERWTGAKLIYKYEQLVEIIKKQKKNTWLIINTLWGKKLLEEEVFFEKFKKYEMFTNNDSSAIVYKIAQYNK